MIRRTLLDRAIGYFDPAREMKRVRARTALALFGGYESGARDRRATRGWRPWAQSANEDILPDLLDLRTRSRDLTRNVPVAAGAIATVVTNVVGDGLALQPIVDRDVLGLSEEAARAWQRQALREFLLWSRCPDFTGRLNFDELQALVFRAALESGDVFVVRRDRQDPGDTYSTKLQVVEADRVSNPNNAQNTATLADGIVLDDLGRPVGCHIATMHPQEWTPGKRRTWQQYPFRSATGFPLILHLYDQRRPDQARGVPYLAPVIAAIKQLGDYGEAELRAAVVSALYTVFITSNADDDDNPVAGEKDEGLDENELKLGSGAVLSLNPGETPQFANPTRPNSGFDAFVNSLARQIGVALELPYEVLLKSFTASYSASRAALEMAWQFFRVRRSWLAWKFCQPVYEWVIAEAVARGRLAAPGFFADPVVREAWLGADWIGPSRIQLDPLKEAQADRVDLEMRTKTRAQIIMERTGGTFEQKVAQLAEEQESLAAAGLAPLAPPSAVQQDVPANAQETEQ